ncbi:helix-turn-helix domain-containing protein [Modicisalibacter xianhensis]|uniref:CRP/FNR family transcriptional regulator n=1 Tax=Modicisalibacter xianhensis TaxID=442341 RepID=A0A1I3FM55_9GAMM|nr:helix-turn-helix domain-containing protein [Halomonas xianhensis]TDX22865.1 CRP/FNR family transcriptional regulator [Halomonas xianhensis]SFI12244.1 CRP/FNR family transcriptional regulator, anaerobic regulatory protein [Halomonas xianhensis]
MRLIHAGAAPQANQYSMPEEIDFPASDALRKSFRRLPAFRRKQELVKQGEAFHGLYIVRCGMLKQSFRDKGGGYQITHVFLPGDVIGLDAIEDRRYVGKVTVLETAGLLHIPFDRLEKFPGVQTDHLQLVCYLSRTMQRELTRMWNMMSQPSDVRLARFFLAMSSSFQAQGFSPSCFRLPMTRCEIANYLYMADETLSRLVGRFQRTNILAAQGREFCIKDMERLKSIAEAAE